MVAFQRRITVAVAVGLTSFILTAAGERIAGDIQLDSESLNACGVSFAADGDVEMGWTVGQHGLHGVGSDAGAEAAGLESGIWPGGAFRFFEGTVFKFR